MDNLHRLTVPRRPSGLALTTFTAIAAIAMAATLLLAGCASPGDVHPQSKPVVPAAVGLDGGGTAPALAQAWWQDFKDPQLDQLVQRALSDNPSLKSAQVRVQRAQALVAGAQAAELPQVNGSFEGTRQRYPEHGLFPPPLAGSMQTSATLQAGASWEIDFFGRHLAALEAALGAQRAAEADAQAARVLLAANVSRAYVQLARLQEQRAVSERALAQRADILALIRQRVQAGIDTNVELRQGEGALPELRQQLAALDEQAALTRHALAALTAQPPQALDGLAPRLQAVQAVPLPASVPADLLGRRADIEAARQRIEAATQDLQAARAQFYPSVNLVAFAGFSAIGLDRLIETGSRQYGVGPAIHLPIFDAGRLRANYRGKAADLDAAVEAYNGAVLEAVRDVADQISSLQSIARQQQEQASAQAAAESAYELATQRYKAGLGPYLTVLIAESNVLAQRRAAADLKARALDSQVALMRALGGGYTAPAQQLAQAH
ncbi:efflux transporter outer membrane subunit [Ideonella sp. BN130291]|uniref:efflux transporter outer membrane subunit n=1 Tax=Ideonella sp. BN130291 TaxID=3112940 RepID=UPI002E272CFE|nr:efflux transporter outer membrane subunit [Ideonella sp. BN130291]